MDGLILALQERQPDPPLERIQQGVALFLARRFRDETARSASRQRQIFHLSLAVTRSPTHPDARRETSARPLSPVAPRPGRAAIMKGISQNPSRGVLRPAHRIHDEV